MTLANLMPIRLGLWGKPTGKRRQDDVVDLLQCKLIGARLLIKGLRLQLEDQESRHAETVARIDERHAEIVRGLEGRIADLERRLNVGVLAESVVTKTQELSLEEIRRHCVIPLREAPFAATDPGRIGHP
ncbi:hypothetical protein [Streptomyces sp. NPDC003832]